MPDGIQIIERPIPPPAQHRGQARVLIQRIAKLNDTLEAATAQVFAPLKARVASGNPTPRYQTMIEAIRQWELVVPRDGRLHVDCKLERKSLRLNEIRITGAEYAKDAWRDEHVGALLVSELCMEASKQRTAVAARILALVTFHCIARWYERSVDTSEPALMLDLLHLARAAEQIGKDARADPHKRWEWVAPSGLRFVGNWCYRELKGVRTYFIGADTCKPQNFVRWAA